ncbi:GTP pyrophosphokinase family protein [Paenibacillus lentus]|uniref:GTP pyrophosphokinase family protein n=1 Tax=Paenibacillus lentus TaxID=1338368 RepID=A0A3S8RPY7_9BACL|nr:GTP pyrophosphokinase family protein [Paenibacillus lentus]AZK44909.1 GTP pyrophosphokinase family protein [Paenibacillus lentus]
MDLRDLYHWEVGDDELRKLEEWKKLPTLYQLALDELKNKVKLIQTEWKILNGYSPIEHIKTRIKEPKSILDKLERKGLEMTVDNMVNKIHDIAGMRIVFSFVKDIYKLLDHLRHREDITIIEIKDYIAKPKPNGYQSLHVIVAVPLTLFEGQRWMKVEIQMRTLAMDFWASMEHILFYKYDKQVPSHVVRELTEAAKAADALDKKMHGLRKEIMGAAEANLPEPGTSLP